MPSLIACTSCHAHIRAGEGVCPHCGGILEAQEGRLGRTASAILMGLTITGCGPQIGDDAASASESASTSGVATSTTTLESTTSANTHETTTAQPAYGVPDTGWETGDEESASTTSSTTDSTTGSSDDTTGTSSDTGDSGESSSSDEGGVSFLDPLHDADSSA